MRSSVAPFFPRFQREGVVGAISARLHIAAMGMPLVFARAKRLASGSSFCISRHNIGSNAWMQVQSCLDRPIGIFAMLQPMASVYDVIQMIPDQIGRASCRDRVWRYV